MLEALRAAIGRTSPRILAVKAVLTLAFVAAGIAWIVIRRRDFAQLDWPSAGPVLAIAAAYAANLALVAWFNVVALRRLGASMTGFESFAMSAVASAANLLLPLRAGTAVRAYYLKQVHGLAYSGFASTLVLYYFFTLLVAALAAASCGVALYAVLDRFPTDLLVLLPLALVAAGALAVIRPASSAPAMESAHPLNAFAGALRGLLADRRLNAVALAAVVAALAASTAGWTLALRDYSPDVMAGEALLIVVSQVAGGLVTLTAGSTGFQELAGLYVGERLGMTMVELFASLVWIRVARTLAGLLLAAPSALYLARRRRMRMAQRSSL